MGLGFAGSVYLGDLANSRFQLASGEIWGYILRARSDTGWLLLATSFTLVACSMPYIACG